MRKWNRKPDYKAYYINAKHVSILDMYLVWRWRWWWAWWGGAPSGLADQYYIQMEQKMKEQQAALSRSNLLSATNNLQLISRESACESPPPSSSSSRHKSSKSHRKETLSRTASRESSKSKPRKVIHSGSAQKRRTTRHSKSRTSKGRPSTESARICQSTGLKQAAASNRPHSVMLWSKTLWLRCDEQCLPKNRDS